jgi:hypothetical protein
MRTTIGVLWGTASAPTNTFPSLGSPIAVFPPTLHHAADTRRRPLRAWVAGFAHIERG